MHHDEHQPTSAEGHTRLSASWLQGKLPIDRYFLWECHQCWIDGCFQPRTCYFRFLLACPYYPIVRRFKSYDHSGFLLLLQQLRESTCHQQANMGRGPLKITHFQRRTGRHQQRERLGFFMRLKSCKEWSLYIYIYIYSPHRNRECSSSAICTGTHLQLKVFPSLIVTGAFE